MKARMSSRFRKICNKNPKFAKKILKTICNNPTKVINHESIIVTDENGNTISVKQI